MAALPKMTSYFSKETQVSVLMPETWTGQVVSDSQFRIWSPPEQVYAGFRSSMSYTRGKPEQPDEGWFLEAIEQSGHDMAESYPKYQVLGEERFTLSSLTPTYVRRYRWRPEESEAPFSQLQALIWVNRANMLLVNAMTLEPLEQELMPVCEAILRSTRILGPAPAE